MANFATPYKECGAGSLTLLIPAIPVQSTPIAPDLSRVAIGICGSRGSELGRIKSKMCFPESEGLCGSSAPISFL